MFLFIERKLNANPWKIWIFTNNTEQITNGLYVLTFIWIFVQTKTTDVNIIELDLLSNNRFYQITVILINY